MSSVAEGPLANVRAVVERAKTREPDPDDRRASRVALTAAGKRKLTAALKTYEAEVAGILGGVLRPEEQQQMSD
jgi:DNA-binding MarR family transcriptional regulator